MGVSYPREMRKTARAEGLGLVTVHVERPNGEKTEVQGPANVEACKFYLWAAALYFCEELRRYPDLEKLTRDVMEKHDIPRT